IASGDRRQAVLYWGGRRPADLYMHDKALEWAAALPNFSYVPVISDAQAGDGWIGRSGFVHQAVLQDIPDLSGYQVYACGAPIMVDSARKDFIQLNGLAEDDFFADAF
ncbi:MAG: CDP-6-deoxy-delta-3,4-glucoseen reductase, partial [Pollutimonas bauzanensis]